MSRIYSLRCSCVAFALVLAVVAAPAVAQEARCGTVSAGASMNSAEDLAFNVGQAVAGYATDGSIIMHAGVIPCLEGVGGGGNEIVWTGNGDGTNWHDPLNWNLARAPAAGDEVSIPDVAQTAEVVYSTSAGATTVESLDCDEAFAMTGQTFTIRSSAAFNADLRMTAGTLTGDADMTVAGQLHWTGGTMAGAGSTTATGGMLLSGASVKRLERPMRSTGDSIWTDNGGFYIGAGATFTNAAGATFDAQGDGTLWWSVQPAGSFVNQGTFLKSAGVTQTQFRTRFDNQGAVVVAAGRVQVLGDGTHTGDFSGQGILEIAGGTTAFEAASIVQCGELRIAGGTTTVLGTFDVGALAVSTGAIAFDSTQVANITSYAQTGGFVQGSGDVLVADRMTWTAGSIRGTGATFAENGLALSGAAVKTLERDMLSSGDSTWQDNGGFYIGGGATFTNGPGTDFDMQGDGTLWWSSQPPGTFVNQGRLRKSGGAGSSRVITPMDNSGTVDVASGTLSIESSGTHTGTFTGVGILDLGNGARSFEAASSIQCADLRITGSTSTVLGQFDVGRLTITSAGALILNSAQPGRVGTYVHAKGTFDGSADLSVTGPITFTGGIMRGSGTTFAEGGLALSAPGVKQLNRDMLSTGNSIWLDNGGFYIGAGATFTNAAGALFDIQGDGTIWWSAQPPGTFVNQGTLRKSGGAGATRIVNAFDNHGSVDVVAGTLRLEGAGTHAGAFTGPGILDLSNGTRIFEAASSIQSDNLLVTNGVSTILGQFDVANLALSVGAIHFDAAQPARIATYSQSGGTLAGAGDVTITGPIAWTGGTMQGTGATAAEGGITLSGAALKALNRDMLSSGDGRWQDNGPFYIGAGAAFTNAAGATFEAQGGATLWWSTQPPGSFVNRGTFRKSGAARTRLLNPFENAGALEVAGGELQLEGDSTHTGTLAGAGLLILQSGSHRFEAGSAVRAENLEIGGGTTTVLGEFGATSFTVVNGTIHFDAPTPAVIQGYRQAGGVTQGAGDIRIDGAVAWTAGTMAGAGTTFADGGITLSGNPVKTLNRNMISSGDTLWIDSGPFYIGNGATFTNAPGAAFDAQSDGTIWWSAAPAGTFDNRGTFLKSGAGTKIVQVAFANSGRLEQTAGLLRFPTGGFTQSAGLTLLDGGDIAATVPLNFDGGELGGIGTITADVFNNGAAISPGLPIGGLTIDGDYISTGPAAVIRLDIAGLTPEVDFDVLEVAGDAVVSGSVTADFGNAFAPQINDAFRFVTAGGARSGLFSGLSVTNRPPGPGLLGLAYDAAFAELRVTQPSISNRAP